MAHACPNDFDVIEVKVTGTNGLGVPAHKGYSPSGLVPALHDSAVTDAATGECVRVWDSLAIAEYIAEACPLAPVWPRDPVKRAMARYDAPKPLSPCV
jgi:glutathione S-transferase